MTKRMTTHNVNTSEYSGEIDNESRAVRYRAPSQTDRIQAILDELNRIHPVESPGEAELVERLALSRAKVYEAEKTLDERFRWQRANAEELFERLHHERFTHDLFAWRENPVRMTAVFGKTWHSAIFLRDLWNAVRSAISNGLGVTYDQGKEMVAALGGDWHADRIDIHRGRIFSLILSFDANPEALAERWVKASRAGRSDTGSLEDDMDRAQWFLASAPGANAARDELKNLAENQFRFWSAESERLAALHAAERARCIEVPTRQPLGNSDDIRTTRQLQRELTLAENRADKLERRLLTLRKSHQMKDLRHPKTPAGQSAARSHATTQSPAMPTPEASMTICTTPAASPPPDSPKAPVALTDKQDVREKPMLETPASSAMDVVSNAVAIVTRTACRPDPNCIARKARARSQLVRSGRNARTGVDQKSPIPAR